MKLVSLRNFSCVFGVLVVSLSLANAQPESAVFEGESGDVPSNQGSGANAVRGVILDFDGSNETIGSATIISTDDRSTQVGVLSLQPGDVDYFSVSLTAGERIVVMTTPLSNPRNGFSSPDTVISIRNAADAVLVSDGDAGSDFPSAVVRGSVARYRAAAAETVYIRVAGGNAQQQGPYALLVSSVNSSDWPETFNDTMLAADGIPLAMIGQSVGSAGTEGAGNTDDYYYLDLNVGDVLMATVVPVGNNDMTAPDVRMQLIDTDGVTTLVTSVDDLGGQDVGPAVACTIRARIPATGRYYLYITDENDNSFLFYRLVTARIPAPFCEGDADGNGTVEFNDINTVLLNFTNLCP